MKSLTIVMVTHNRLDYTKRTIASLKKTVPDAKLCIFDNNSTEEGMRSFLVGGMGDAWGDNCIVCADFGTNHGWGHAVNLLLGYAKDERFSIDPIDTDMILISNNDVEYHPGWYERASILYNKYPDIGILAVWKHTAHGIKHDLGDLIVKDQMPAVGWLTRKSVLDKVGPIAEHGPCATKGGNGEDVDYCIRVGNAGLLVCAPKDDIATHIDGY